MKKNYLLFFLLLILSNSYSQCPSGQFGITNPSFEGPVGAHITPSPWSTCGITPDTQPGYWGINLAPSDGSSYVGLVNGGPGWLEGVSQTLSSSLLAGFTYNLTIDLAMGNSNQGGIQPAPTRIKIYGGNAVCQKTQLLWTSPTISHVTWQKYNIILAPNQNFTSIYIVIDDTSPLNSYMLIDNIRQLSTSVASVVSNITCNGGTGGINLTTSGGMPPYIFNWNDGVTTEDRTGLAAGAYTVTVTDANGCISTKSFTITEPTALNSVPTQVNVLCNGNATGSATAVISGGVAPYTYVWNNGITSTTNQATNLEAGTYEVTVTDANGCIIKQNFTITQPDILNINLQETSFNICPACNDSNLVATITGGTTPYTYSWNDGVITKDRSDLLNGTYTLTVTDAKGCTVSKNIVVSTKVELPYRDFTYTNGNAVSELNNFTTCQSGAVVKASSGRYTSGVWYDGSYELFVNNTSLGVFTGEKTIDISNYIPITSVRAVGNHNFWSWTAIDVKTYSDVVDVPPTSPIVSTIYYELNNTAVPLTATLNGVGTTLKWYTDELGSDYSATAPTPLTNQLGTKSYYVSQANSVGCESARAKIDVIVVSPISYTHQINNLLCFTSTGGIDLSVSGGTVSYTYLWSNGATTEDITVSQGGNYTCTITDQNSGFSITTQVLQVLQPLPLQATIVTIDVACFGENNGEAIVTATDGTAPYSYVWNNGITSTTNEATNLAAGTYEVTVTDANGCIIKQSFTITEPDVLNSVPSQVDVLCHGESTGSATAAISGGVALYTYVWNNGITSTTNEATNLAAGTYEVTVTDANGCIIKQSFTITEPSALNSVPSQVDILCHGESTGSATAVISGGVTPYTYVWNNGISSTTNGATNLSAGTYEVTVTDANGCIIKQSFTITEPDVLNSVPSQVDVLCNGESTGSATAAISGGVAPYTYVWNNGITSNTNEATNLAVGTYEVMVTDANGCIITESFTITEPTALQSIPTQVNVLCHGESTGAATAVISGGVTPYTYVWNNGITSSTNEAANLAAGSYEVTVTDANGCIIKQSFTITEPTALNSVPSQMDVLCYSQSTGSATVAISGGVPPYTYVWNNGITSNTNEATNLAAGTYEVTVTDANGCIITESFTIKEPLAVTPPLVVDQNFCIAEKAKISNLAVTGTGVQWYDVAVGGSPLNTADLLDTGTYYATQTINGCESITRTAIQVTIYNTPPAIANDQQFCIDANATVADLVAIGVNLKWYNSSTATTPLATTALLATSTYFVSQTINGCESVIRTAVQISVHNTVAPIAGNQEFCLTLNAKVSDLIVNGTAVKWYNTPTGGTALNASDLLSTGIYYATQTLNGCESVKRTIVNVVINKPIQLITTQLNVCSNTRVQNIIIEGFNYNQLKWYNSATSTTQLVSSQLLISGTYYISTFAGGCESSRQSIQVTVAAVVPTPTASFQTVCTGTQLSDLTVTKDPSAVLRWYTSLQSMIPVSENTIVSTGTYYVVQVIGECESARVAVQVQAVNVSEPTVFNITMCEGTTIGDLNTGTNNYVWYVDNTTQIPLPDSFVITSGNYYISNKVSTCISGRKLIATNVSARPQSPTGQSKQTFNYSARIANIRMNEPNLKWFATYNDAIMQVNELGVNHYLQDATTYYAIAVGQNNCGSFIPTAVEVTINLGIKDLDMAQLNFYPNPVETVLNIDYIQEIKEIEVYTITGQRVFSEEFNTNKVTVDMSRLSQGTYLVHIKTEMAQQFIKVLKK